MTSDEPILSLRANSAILGPEFFAAQGSNDLGKLFQKVTWVGGRITLSAEYLFFAANRLNRAANSNLRVRGRYDAHAQMHEFGIAVRDIAAVHLRSWAWVKVIQIDLNTGYTLGLVVRKAREVHEQILALTSST